MFIWRDANQVVNINLHVVCDIGIGKPLVNSKRDSWKHDTKWGDKVRVILVIVLDSNSSILFHRG